MEELRREKSASSSNDPDAYKRTPSANFTLNNDVEDIFSNLAKAIPEDKAKQVESWVKFLVEKGVKTPKDLERAFVLLRRRDKTTFKKSMILQSYMKLVALGEIEANDSFKQLLVKKAQKSQSGVLVVTVLTSPYPVSQGKKQRFSCQWNCYYCPNEPGQPRSYLHDEPSVLRANRNKFDPVLQFFDRVAVLEMNGHPVDKIEMLILGGTWASYPQDYQEDFIRDLFFAANVFFTRDVNRERHSLNEEKRINETAQCKIIGITLETRPDCINEEEIRRFRYYGCTRVQLGVQHTYRSILTKINRECYTEDVVRALKLLKDNCYKIDIHLMPNLPGSDVDIDLDMFERILNDPALQADQWKIYPCETTPWTVIKKWYEEGSYKPYPEEELLNLLATVKAQVHPWIRLNRVVRDIPSQYILGGVDNPSMRQVIEHKMKQRGLRCDCIRCREVRGNKVDQVELVVRAYPASEGLEYFISIETPDRRTICGFCRLRIPAYMLKPGELDALVTESTPFIGEHVNHFDQEEPKPSRGRGRVKIVQEEGEVEEATPRSSRSRRRSKSPFRKAPGRSTASEEDVTCANEEQAGKVCGGLSKEMPVIFPELMGAALVRELHVYGQLVATVDKKTKKAQHVGFGTQLMHKAEELASLHGASKLAVISGVGVRNFYRKIGYELQGESEMMIKPVPWHWFGFSVLMGIQMAFLLFSLLLFVDDLDSRVEEVLTLLINHFLDPNEELGIFGL